MLVGMFLCGFSLIARVPQVYQVPRSSSSSYLGSKKRFKEPNSESHKRFKELNAESHNKSEVRRSFSTDLVLCLDSRCVLPLFLCVVFAVIVCLIPEDGKGFFGTQFVIGFGSSFCVERKVI